MVTNALKWPSNEVRKRMESVPLIGKDLFHEEFRSGIEDEATRVESDRKLDRQLGPRLFSSSRSVGSYCKPSQGLSRRVWSRGRERQARPSQREDQIRKPARGHGRGCGGAKAAGSKARP